VERRRFGSTGREVAVIGQGAWRLEQADAETAIAALRRGFDLGMTHVDTAEMYGSGAAEELVGAAIAGRRDEVFLVSKVLPHNASRDEAIASCERSLKRLKTDRLDCYLLHWRGSHPLEDTVAAFEELLADGEILSWGVSNFDVDDLDEVRRIAGAGHLACNPGALPSARARDRKCCDPMVRTQRRRRCRLQPIRPRRRISRHSAGGRVLKEIADRHRATPRQVALRFLTRRASVFAIPKAATPAHTEENAGAGALHLSAAELARIDAAFPLDPRPRPLPML
jgi:diketogulonate reductase-like aldo/keto reductase